MLVFNQVEFSNIVVHNVGNKNNEEDIKLSKNELQIHDQTIRELLLKYFLSPFKDENFYHFYHNSDLQLNEVFNYATQIFNDPSSFFAQSTHLAKHLYDKSVHPKIKGGEFYVVYLNDCVVDDEITDAIGLFKSENKDTYLRVFPQGENYGIDYENGININKLDKGCIIFNTEAEQGYKISIVDNYNKGNEAVYWREDFLKIKPREDNFYSTKNMIDMCHNFGNLVLSEENDVDKTEQVAFIKRTEEYFNEKEEYNNEEFMQEVIQKPEVIDAFNEFKVDYEELHELKPEEKFEISTNAVKKTKGSFKSVIKLDKNFHIYVHSKPEFIEKGYDQDKSLKFYKLFFNNEQ